MTEQAAAQFEAELNRSGAAMIRVAAALGTMAIVSMALVDPYLTSGTDLYHARVVRVVSSTLLTSLYAMTYMGDWTRGRVRPAALASATITGAAVVLLAYCTGGGESDYHEALYVTIFGYAMLPIPWPYKRSAAPIRSVESL